MPLGGYKPTTGLGAGDLCRTGLKALGSAGTETSVIAD
jgi:hypothetical protein